MMRQMLLTRSIGSYIHIEDVNHTSDRRYEKTNAAPVVLIPAYGIFDGNIYYYWAVVGWSKEDVNGNVNTPQFTNYYTATVGERTVYILTLDGGAYRPQDCYIAYRNAEGTVQVTLWPPTQDTCYDLTPSTITETNEAIQEAIALLASVKMKGTAPRKPGNSNKKYTAVYLGSQATSGWDATPFTADIKNLYPKIYSKLTRSNFYSVPFRWFGNSAGNSGNEGNTGDNISYNPVSGIMTGYGTGIGPGGTWAGTLVYKFYMIY